MTINLITTIEQQQQKKYHTYFQWWDIEISLIQRLVPVPIEGEELQWFGSKGVLNRELQCCIGEKKKNHTCKTKKVNTRIIQ